MEVVGDEHAHLLVDVVLVVVRVQDPRAVHQLQDVARVLGEGLDFADDVRVVQAGAALVLDRLPVLVQTRAALSRRHELHELFEGDVASALRHIVLLLAQADDGFSGSAPVVDEEELVHVGRPEAAVGVAYEHEAQVAHQMGRGEGVVGREVPATRTTGITSDTTVTLHAVITTLSKLTSQDGYIKVNMVLKSTDTTRFIREGWVVVRGGYGSGRNHNYDILFNAFIYVFKGLKLNSS